MDDTKMVAVVVTTEHRGVFFGYVPESVANSDESGEFKSLKLQKARNCLYWGEKVKGFLGLAASGPDKQSRVGPAVPALTLTQVTSVAVCTEEARAAWESGPWA